MKIGLIPVNVGVSNAQAMIGMAQVGNNFPLNSSHLSYGLLSADPKTPLEPPSIGLECKTYFPIRPRFFDPGVCSRFGYAVSS